MQKYISSSSVAYNEPLVLEAETDIFRILIISKESQNVPYEDTEALNLELMILLKKLRHLSSDICSSWLLDPETFEPLSSSQISRTPLTP